MPERLLAETRALHEAVDALIATLEREYPKRAEIRKARQSFALAIMIGLIVSAIISIITTIGTVSGCFLSRAAVDGHAAHACSFLPGYDATQDRARRNNARFAQLFSDVAYNKKMNRSQQVELDKLEKKLAASK